MNKENDIKTIADSFIRIKGLVSKKDKESAAAELNVHPETITRYLRGEIGKAHFALELLAVLNRITSNRTKKAFGTKTLNIA